MRPAVLCSLLAIGCGGGEATQPVELEVVES
jgi:hypothetical protein